MNPSKEELQNHYNQLCDDELVILWNKKTLTDIAQEVLLEELKNRGIEPLVAQEEEADEVEMLDAGALVTLTSYLTAAEAHILRARLEVDDIPAFVVDEHLVTANWFLSIAIGGVRVQVPQALFQQASIILQEVESEKLTKRTDESGSIEPTSW